ncbi:nuclear transcription factor Y subunit B-1-like [Cynara cardunculus var. scolymus]|uniref:Histone-fold n=1 Tax=Cynara cardunculus var. scolymus TaxID=59895 RepID=A0A103YGA5_CYNCS|nr:nuclear transcription factor Y subunit B-1-like [Cynara cardunculus var. scolymus]KVI08527.1 Histone-fold [Cynara cardunculus var. scolymus]
MTGKRTQTGSTRTLSSSNVSDGSSKDQERLLPIANVGRIMKKSLPGNAKVSKEAKETVQECVSEFISFITGEAADKCQREKRKTINGDDLLWAMTTLGFQDYVGSLKSYLSKYVGTCDSSSHTDIGVTEIGCDVSDSTPAQSISQGFNDLYQIVGHGDELISMVKLHEAKTVMMTQDQRFEW